MMADYEIEHIKGVLIINGYQSCLEWGSGNSTIYFPNQCPLIKRWLSIEHNGHYITHIKARTKNEAVELRWLGANQTEEDKQEYINGADGEKFDFILVDGLHREECLTKAFTLLNPGGKILVHDTGRQEYQSWLNKYPHTEVFQGQIQQKNGGFAHRGLMEFTI